MSIHAWLAPPGAAVWRTATANGFDFGLVMLCLVVAGVLVLALWPRHRR